MKKRTIMLGIAVCLFLAIGVLPINNSVADTEKDYIKGRPLTEEEIQQQENLEPQLREIIQFDDKRITLENEPQTNLKRSRSSAVAKYDLRDRSYAGYVKVKNQEETGLCWAFAVTTAAEISHFHQQAASGEAISKVEFSPIHLGYFLYHRVDDRLGNTGSDKNIGTIDYKDVGGNNFMTIQALAGWIGFTAESKVPFELRNNDSFSNRLAYDDDYILENAQFIGNSDKTAMREEVKTAIAEKGSVVADMYYDRNYLENSTMAYKTNMSPEYNNHIITIVGWDDNYSKENFLANKRPANNGAWIVQNSYGAEWGDGGYFYVSYEDSSIADPMLMDVQEADTYDYNYQYDGNANPAAVTIPDGAKMANVYTVPSGYPYQYLKAIGFTTANQDKTSYNISIYTGVTGTGRPTNGTKACSFTVTTENEGFHSFKLPKTITLKSGMKYSIVVTMQTDTDFGVESSYDYGWVRFTSGHKKYQSYCYVPSYGWDDLYYDRVCARIKGFATETKPVDISKAQATLSTLYYRCTGEQRRPLPTVKYNGKYLKEGEDYTLKYGTNKYPGYAYIYITGKGEYTGKLTKTFYISRVSGLKVKNYDTDSLTLTWTKQSNVTGYKIYKYSSGEYKYVGTVKGADNNVYTVKRLSPGRGYSFKVRAYKKDNGKIYDGIQSGYMSAPTQPERTTITKLTTGTTHYVSAYWSRRTCTGYQVKIARNSSFTSYDRIYKVTSYKTTSKKITGRTKGKYYYVKVRPYKTYGGKTVYGSWSYYKKIKCR